MAAPGDRAAREEGGGEKAVEEGGADRLGCGAEEGEAGSE